MLILENLGRLGNSVTWHCYCLWSPKRTTCYLEEEEGKNRAEKIVPFVVYFLPLPQGPQCGTRTTFLLSLTLFPANSPGRHNSHFQYLGGYSLFSGQLSRSGFPNSLGTQASKFYPWAVGLVKRPPTPYPSHPYNPAPAFSTRTPLYPGPWTSSWR